MPKTKQGREPKESLGVIGGNPLRLAAWTILAERTASPNELAKELGEPVGNVSYHVRTLEEAGVVELVGTEQRRGATEHFYRGIDRPEFDEGQTAARSLDEVHEIARFTCRLQVGDATLGLKERTFGRRPDHCVVRVPMVVDEEGWSEASKAYERLVAELDTIRGNVAERAAAGKSTADIHARAMANLFEVPPGAGPQVKTDSRI